MDKEWTTKIHNGLWIRILKNMDYGMDKDLFQIHPDPLDVIFSSQTISIHWQFNEVLWQNPEKFNNSSTENQSNQLYFT